MTPKEAFISYFRNFEIDMIESLLDDNRTFQDFPKYLFIKKLANAFQRFINNGDTLLNTYNGTCNSEICSIGCKGIRFIGNHSGLYIDIVFKIENEEIIDVYECHQFSTISPKKTMLEKVFIDTKGLPVSMM